MHCALGLHFGAREASIQRSIIKLVWSYSLAMSSCLIFSGNKAGIVISICLTPYDHMSVGLNLRDVIFWARQIHNYRLDWNPGSAVYDLCSTEKFVWFLWALVSCLVSRGSNYLFTVVVWEVDMITAIICSVQHPAHSKDSTNYISYYYDTFFQGNLISCVCCIYSAGK